MSEKEPYNPLDKHHLGESVADALLRTVVRPLSDTSGLTGAGVYAIYYVGNFPSYLPISSANINGRFDLPIYVGKAVPKGSRKGGLKFSATDGRALRHRLRQHAATIEEATNLQLEDFHFRALVVDDIWIPLGENVLIEKFQPLWNRIIDGFGNKTPGAGRTGSKRSQWDALHPGRAFVEVLRLSQNPLTELEIQRRIAAFYSGNLPESEMLDTEEEA